MFQRLLWIRSALLERWPTMGEGAVGALFCPSGGIVCPYTLVIAMCENAVRNGVEFFLNTEVSEITPLNGGWHLTTRMDRHSIPGLYSIAQELMQIS